MGQSDLYGDEYRLEVLQPQIRTQLRLLGETPRDDVAQGALRGALGELIEQWRCAVRAEVGEQPDHPVSRRTAAALLGTDEAGLDRLIDWGLLTTRHLPSRASLDGEPTTVLRSEIERLLDEEGWWRGLVDLLPPPTAV